MRYFNIFTVPTHGGTSLVEREDPDGIWVRRSDLPQYKHLSEGFLKAMDEIGEYGFLKHRVNSFQHKASIGDFTRSIHRHSTAEIMSHARMHTLDYEAGNVHDHFNDLLHQLAATAFNAMVEAQFARIDKPKSADYLKK